MLGGCTARWLYCRAWALGKIGNLGRVAEEALQVVTSILTCTWELAELRRGWCCVFQANDLAAELQL